MNSKLLYTTFFILLFLSSCHDDLEITSSIDEEVPSPEVIQEIQGEVIGYVFDEDRNPVSNVSITTYAEETKTDVFGVFRLRGTKLDPNGTYIQANHDNYIIGSDMIYPENALNHSYIQLLSLSETSSFNSANGAEVTAEGGGKVIFEANSIANEDGSMYSGEVIVTAKRIGPENPDYMDQMPGALIAQDNEGYTRVLGTLGMLAVELRSPQGEELNIASGKTARLQFMLSQEQLQNAPNEIPVWYFDHDKAIWIEEGSAQLDGNIYQVDIAHFSFWNCDAPFPLVHVCGNIYYDNGSPVENIKVNVFAEGLGTACGYTDSEGRFCGKMPKNVPLKITIYNPFCPEELQTVDVGPFTQNTELDDIILNTQSFVLFGQVTCLEGPVTDGYFVISANESESIYSLNEDGNYEINLSSILCANIESVEVFAVNAANNQASSPVTVSLTNGEINLDIETCADCDFALEISEGDDNDCNALELTAEATGGSGDYSYLWNNETESESTLSYGGIVCVTVLDNVTQCDQTVCVDIEERVKFTVSVDVLNASCDMDNGLAERRVENGQEPYQFEWINENGTVISNEPFVENLSPGLYTLFATDANGCEDSKTFEIVDAGDIQLFFEIDNACEETFVFPIATGGSGNYVYSSDDGQTGDVFIFTIPGEFCITAVDANGCEVTECVQIDLIMNQDFGYSAVCDSFFYEMSFFPPEFLFELRPTDMNLDTFIIINPGESLSYNILDLGFSFTVFGINFNGSECEIFETITLPNYTGLIIEENPASCDICEDGWINAEFAVDGSCFNCEEALIEIYAVDGLDNELSNINDNMTLSSGEYYVVVKDVEGCVVAFELVSL